MGVVTFMVYEDIMKVNSLLILYHKLINLYFYYFKTNSKMLLVLFAELNKIDK